MVRFADAARRCPATPVEGFITRRRGITDARERLLKIFHLDRAARARHWEGAGRARARVKVRRVRGPARAPRGGHQQDQRRGREHRHRAGPHQRDKRAHQVYSSCPVKNRKHLEGVLPPDRQDPGAWSPSKRVRGSTRLPVSGARHLPERGGPDRALPRLDGVLRRDRRGRLGLHRRHARDRAALHRPRHRARFRRLLGAERTSRWSTRTHDWVLMPRRRRGARARGASRPRAAALARGDPAIAGYASSSGSPSTWASGRSVRRVVGRLAASPVPPRARRHSGGVEPHDRVSTRRHRSCGCPAQLPALDLPPACPSTSDHRPLLGALHGALVRTNEIALPARRSAVAPARRASSEGYDAASRASARGSPASSCPPRPRTTSS